jgi:putative transposase
LLGEASHIERLRKGFRRTMAKPPFRIDAIVILPEHLHSAWRLEPAHLAGAGRE